MRREITQRELRNDSGEVLRAVSHGEEFVVTRNGEPVGTLTPLHRRTFVSKSELARAAERMPRIDSARFRAGLDEIAEQELFRTTTTHDPAQGR